MILIGSQALNYYINLNRILHDWDVIVTENEYLEFNNNYQDKWVKSTPYSYIYDFGDRIVELTIAKLPTDRLLFFSPNIGKVKAEFGSLEIPPIQLLYDIKKSTSEVIKEPKHLYDVKLIEEKYPDIIKNTEFYTHRLQETIEKVKKSNKIKYDFFHKYHIPEYILHDRLHEMFADLLGISIPTYQRITTAEVDISESLFNKLSHEQKISLMVEEVLVLNMERWFIPQMIENGINYRLIDHFYNNNEAMPPFLILKHVCLTGLKGEAKYITDFSKANFFEIEKEWVKAKSKIKLPQWFFNELFELREKYKNGIPCQI